MMISWPISDVAATITEPDALGSKWRTRMRRLDAPDARAASANSEYLSERTAAHTTRATGAQRTVQSHNPFPSGVTGYFDHTSTTIRTTIAGTATTTAVPPEPTASSQPP